MSVLLIHNEQEYYAGAERMLINHVIGLQAADIRNAAMAVAGTRVFKELSKRTRTIPLPGNQPFSTGNFARQAIAGMREIDPFERTIVHGWSARDWDTTAIIGRMTASPTMGTLHDHPAAPFISPARKRLMKLSAKGLDKIVCVSDAVRQACLAQHYAPDRLVTIHNGIASATPALQSSSRGLTLGFLGAFSRRKGLSLLFDVITEFAAHHPTGWRLRLAGAPQDDEGRSLWRELEDRHSAAKWWPQVELCGWLDDPQEFLSGLDLLLFTSQDFDPFPTVILEAGQCGTPVLAADVGGVSEMISENINGWLFSPARPVEAASRMVTLVKARAKLRRIRKRASEHILRNFSLGKMIEEYGRVYSTLRGDDQ